jgi:hypothetical protein
MKRFITLLAVTAIVLPTMLACGEKETPEQRLAHLRSRHEIFTDAEGNTLLIVDVQIANQGTDPLSQLTVLVTVRGGDGSERLSQRATLDLEGVQPGVGVRRTAIIPGYQLAEDDEVIVEREANLSPAELRSLPEWSDVEGMER